MPTKTSAPPRSRPTRSLAVLFALAATLAVWVIASVAGVDLTVKSGPHDVRTVGLASVVLATLAAGVGACALLAATQRFARRPGTTFAASAFALLLVSLAGPIGLGHTTGAQAMLTSMHLAAAGVLIPGLARSAGWVDSIPRSPEGSSRVGRLVSRHAAAVHLPERTRGRFTGTV